MTERARLNEVVSGVSSAFGQAAALPSRVSPSIPISFFGDLHAYFSSRVRVLTVGLNPSLHEFPADSPFRRFPLATLDGAFRCLLDDFRVEGITPPELDQRRLL